MLIVLLIIASSDLITRITPSTFRPTVRPSSTKPIAVTRPRSPTTKVSSTTKKPILTPTTKVSSTTKRPILTPRITKPLSGDPNQIAALLLASANQNSSAMTVNIINVGNTLSNSVVNANNNNLNSGNTVVANNNNQNSGNTLNAVSNVLTNISGNTVGSNNAIGNTVGSNNVNVAINQKPKPVPLPETSDTLLMEP